MKIILFLSLLIWVIPGFGKVKIQKPRSQHVTAFAIIVDEMTLEKTGGAVEAYRDALEWIVDLYCQWKLEKSG